MDIVAINADPDMRHTPLGRVSLQQPRVGGAVFVVLQREHDNKHAMVGVVDASTGRGVMDALYGKRQWEAQHLAVLAERTRIDGEQSRDREIQQRRADFRRELDKKMSASVDGRDKVLALFHGVRR